MTAPSGVELEAITYGCAIVALRAPDRLGRLEDIVLGFDRLDGYLDRAPYIGAVVGRYANRIARARFTLDGREHVLAANDPPNHLHGGVTGFDKRVWQAETAGGGRAVVFRRRSPDGEEGYPGALDVEVTYHLDDDGTLRVAFDARADAPTPVNLVQHSYFNLRGEGSGDVLGHRLRVEAARYLPIDAASIPTGEAAPVAGTPFDFRQPAAIGERLDRPHEQLSRAGGFDHTFVLDRPGADAMASAAWLHDPSSGRTLEVRTTEPGLHVYSGNYLDGALVGPSGRPYVRRGGLCLETQHFPDSPNHPAFPSTILRPGGRYRSQTEFAFGIE